MKIILILLFKLAQSTIFKQIEDFAKNYFGEIKKELEKLDQLVSQQPTPIKKDEDLTMDQIMNFFNSLKIKYSEDDIQNCFFKNLKNKVLFIQLIDNLKKGNLSHSLKVINQLIESLSKDEKCTKVRLLELLKQFESWNRGLSEISVYEQYTKKDKSLSNNLKTLKGSMLYNISEKRMDKLGQSVQHLIDFLDKSESPLFVLAESQAGSVLFLEGLIMGFGIPITKSLNDCFQDVSELITVAEKEFQVIESLDKNQIIQSLKNLIKLGREMPVALGDCKSSKEQLQPLINEIDNIIESEDIIVKIGEDIIVNGVQIYHDIKLAIEFYHEKNWKKVGISLGNALYKIIEGQQINLEY